MPTADEYLQRALEARDRAVAAADEAIAIRDAVVARSLAKSPTVLSRIKRWLTEPIPSGVPPRQLRQDGDE